MATRLATTRNNFITVTAVKNEEESDANTSIATSNTTNTINCTNADIQRGHLTPVSLHHVNLSQVITFEQSFTTNRSIINDYICIEKNNSSDGTVGERERD